MKINLLKFKNFKGVGGKWEEFTFPLSLNLINGDVGCGKTTVFSALTYALYNKNTDFKGNSKSTLPVNRLINDVNKKELVVEVQLDNGYTIKRGQKPDLFEIWKDGENLANKSVTVDQSFLENTVLGGMTLDIFLSTVYLSNKPGSIPFIHMTNAQRKEYIEKVLDLRKLHYYNENLKTFITENKLEKVSLDKEALLIDETITNEEYNIQVQLKKRDEDEQKLKEYKLKYTQRLENEQKIAKELEKEIEYLEEEIKTYKVPKIETDNIDKNIKELESSIDELKTSNEIKEKINTIQNEINKLRREKGDIEFQLNMTESDLEFLKQDIQDEEDILYSSLKQEIQTNQEKLSKLKDIVTQKKAGYDAFMKSKENYHFCGNCPTLSKIIGSYDIEEYNIFINKAKETILNIKATLDSQLIKEEEIQKKKEKNREIQDNIKETSARIDKMKDKIKFYESSIQNLEDSKKSTEENLRKEIEYKIQNINTRIKSLQEKKESLYKDGINELQYKKDKNISNLKYTKDKINMIKNETPPVVREVDSSYLDGLKKKKEEIQKKIDIEYNKTVELDALKKEINSPEHKIKAIRKYIPIFENKLNQVLDIFMEDDVFDLKAKLSDEFALTFYKNGKEIPVFTLSSGQVACCSLACTFAFLYLLEVKHQNNFNHLLIDELLDIHIGTRVEKVIKYLKTISNNKNISVISHNKSLDVGLFDTITYVTKDDLFSKYLIQ